MNFLNINDKNIFLGLTLAFLLIGCGKPVREFGQFGAYVNQFEDYSKQYGEKPISVDNLIIKFGTLKPSTLGECTIGAGTPTITINQLTWAELSEDEQETLMLHELGHCVKFLRHREGTQEPERKLRSIMNPWPQQLTDYGEHKEGYLKELFES